MAEYCLCCGKKIGKFADGHMDNKVCDGCYFKFAGYLQSMEASTLLDELNFNYETLIHIIDTCKFRSEGRDYVILTINKIKEEKKLELKNKKESLSMNELANLQAIRKQEEMERQRLKLKEEILLTTGYSFEGYLISEYCGIKNGSVVLGTGLFSELSASFSDFFGEKNRTMSQKIERAKKAAINILIDNSILEGANGIIGIDYDIMTIGANMIVVSANGTAVKIYKKEENQQ